MTPLSRWTESSDSLAWAPGHLGKGYLLHNGTIKTWSVDPYNPIDQRERWQQSHELSPIALNFEIDPDGGVVTASPTTKVLGIVQADPRLYDAGQRPTWEDDWDLGDFEPQETKEQGRPDMNFIMSAESFLPIPMTGGCPRCHGHHVDDETGECQDKPKGSAPKLRFKTGPSSVSTPRTSAMWEWPEDWPNPDRAEANHNRCPQCGTPQLNRFGHCDLCGYVVPYDGGETEDMADFELAPRVRGIILPKGRDFGPRHEGAWHFSDFEGYTNWDTMSVGLTMDNDQPLYDASHKMIERGGTIQQFRDWATRKIIGPHNREQIKDAKEWNAIPLEERQRRKRQHDIDAYGEAAVNMGESLMQPFKDWENEGKDEDEIRRDEEYDAPDLIDPELVNWDELYNGLKDELDEGAAYDRQINDMTSQGLGWPSNHDLATNQMRDAMYRFHGLKPEDDDAHRHSVNVPWEHFRQMEGNPENWLSLDSREAVSDLMRSEEMQKELARLKADSRYADVDPQSLQEIAEGLTDRRRMQWRDQSYGWDDPRFQHIFDADPRVQEIRQQGYQKRLTEHTWDLIHDIWNGRQNPYADQMPQALQQRGYTPEQIAQLTAQKWRWDPELNQRFPVDATPPVAQWADTSQDQPGDLTIPQEWTSSRSASVIPDMAATLSPATELREWLADIGASDPAPSIHHADESDFIQAPPVSTANDLAYYPPAHIPKELKQAGMTQTQLLQLAQGLPQDQSMVVHQFPDGWSIREPLNYGDLHREGTLMGTGPSSVSSPREASVTANSTGTAHFNRWTGKLCRCPWHGTHRQTQRNQRFAGEHINKLRKAPDKAYKTPEGQEFLDRLLNHHPEQYESLFPYLAHRFKKGDVGLNQKPHHPHGLTWDVYGDGGPPASHLDFNDLHRWHQWYEARQHPTRRGVNIMDNAFTPIELEKKSREHRSALEEERDRKEMLALGKTDYKFLGKPGGGIDWDKAVEDAKHRDDGEPGYYDRLQQWHDAPDNLRDTELLRDNEGQSDRHQMNLLGEPDGRPIDPYHDPEVHGAGSQYTPEQQQARRDQLRQLHQDVEHEFRIPNRNPGWHIKHLNARTNDAGDDNDIERAMEAEGDTMGHCIGSDEQPYKRNAVNGDINAYSLRDPKGEPHATWHYNSDGSLAEMFGPNDDPIKPEYQDMLDEWGQERGRDTREGDAVGHQEEAEDPYDDYFTFPAAEDMDDYLRWHGDETDWDFAHSHGNIGENTQIDNESPNWDRIARDYLSGGGGHNLEDFHRLLHERSDEGEMSDALASRFDPEDEDERDVVHGWNAQVHNPRHEIEVSDPSVNEVDKYNEALDSGQYPEPDDWDAMAHDYLNYSDQYGGGPRSYETGDGMIRQQMPYERSVYEDFHEHIHPDNHSGHDQPMGEALQRNIDWDNPKHVNAIGYWNNAMPTNVVPGATPPPAPLPGQTGWDWPQHWTQGDQDTTNYNWDKSQYAVPSNSEYIPPTFATHGSTEPQMTLSPATELQEWLADLGGEESPASIHHRDQSDFIQAPQPTTATGLSYFPPSHIPKEYKHSAMTLPQEQRAWEMVGAMGNEVGRLPNGYTVEQHDDPNSVHGVGQFMHNCWQEREPERIAEEQGKGFAYHSLHDEHGLPRAAFYVATNPRINNGNPSLTEMWGMRNQELGPEHTKPLADWATQQGYQIKGKDPQEWLDQDNEWRNHWDNVAEQNRQRNAGSPINQADATNDPLGKNPAIVPSRMGDPDYLKPEFCPACHIEHRADEPCPDGAVNQYKQMERQWYDTDSNALHSAPDGLQDHQADLGSTSKIAVQAKPFEQMMWRGGRPDSDFENRDRVYTTDDARGASQYGQPTQVRVRFENPLYHTHQPDAGSWRDQLETYTEPGQQWPAIAQRGHDGIVYDWPNSDSGSPYYAGNRWAISLQPGLVKRVTSSSSLVEAIAALRPQMAAEAQKIYDSWQPENEFDDWGDGGICDSIAQELGGVIARTIPDVEIREGGWEGDDHAYVIASLNGEEVVVDIPARTYEMGGGYSWEKIPGVTITPNDVVVESLT